MSVRFHCDWKGCKATTDDHEGSGWMLIEGYHEFYTGDDPPSDQARRAHLCRKHVEALRKHVPLND